ncbi:Histone deacetylase superfamily,Histone deacetylase domain [Cinara cedri]|uniref:Histone deacetylase superfamily,Histone deacetylase domain n=1 Tax=Cinara cedri TaxID=506608 RepID=A0A5E4MK91_9HEMI|nr:Histone deacetylase superfamily,Histone deacetylase domain [Cinara cedri]
MMTGVVYDDDFTVHGCLWDENYSESPQRFTSILQRCNSLGLIDRCVKIDARPATREELLSKHTIEHVDLLKSTQDLHDEELLENISSEYDSIYLHPFTYKQCLLAAGSSIELAKAVADGRVINGMAIVRPPGHHAMKSEYCGYCFFNNVAIAAQYLLDKTTVRKILIVDWDIHHGQATQQMFYDDPRVLYFSIHRYEHGQFWPNLRESDFDHVGHGNGTGFNVNVPLNKTAMKNDDYMAITHYLLIPLAIEFSPDFIIISSGYDSAIGDPKGEMLVTPACYAHITQKLMNLTHGKIISILEGGYYLKSLAEGAALTLRALLGDPCPVIDSLRQPCDSVMETIRSVIHVHAMYWDCFKYSILYSEILPEIRYDFVVEKSTEKSKIIYQTRNMYSKIDTKRLDTILNNIITDTRLFNPPIRMGLIIETVEHSITNTEHSDVYEYLKSHVGHLHILNERQSTIKELNLAHSTKHIEYMIQMNQQKYTNDNNYFESIENNLALNTFRYFVGSLLQIIDSIFESKIRSGIYVKLPVEDSAKDLCFLNASVISAKYAIQKYKLKRILIIELNEDISQLHYDDQILVISVQRILNGLSLENKNITALWSKEILNDADFTTMMLHLILPIAYEYNPELIIMSTKFDLNMNTISGIQITPIIYGHLTQWLSTLANGKLMVCEQKVNSYSIYRKECLLECSKALLGIPISKLCVKKQLNLETKQILHNNIKRHIKNWKSLQLNINKLVE